LKQIIVCSGSEDEDEAEFELFLAEDRTSRRTLKGRQGWVNEYGSGCMGLRLRNSEPTFLNRMRVYDERKVAAGRHGILPM
jgi:hypothetical protein